MRAKKLKENIERYCVGMGMEGLKPKSYSSAQDETIGKLGSAENVASLTRQLKGIYDVIKSERRELSTEAVVPGARRRRLPVVGTATTQRLDLESRRLASDEELERRAEERCSSKKREQPPTLRLQLPTIDDTLVGTRVEVLWELAGQPGAYWMPGVIEKTSTANSKDGRRILGLGWIFVNYDDGFAGWLKADRPTFFNGTKPGSWRFESAGNEYDYEDDEDNVNDDEDATMEVDNDDG